MIILFGIYLLKSTIVSGIFYLVYRLFFKKESFFSLSRFYLLNSLLFSYLFPFINIPVSEETVKEMAVISTLQTTVNQFRFTEEVPVTISHNSIAEYDYNQWLWLITGIICSLFLFRFIKHIIHLRKTISSHEKIKEPDYTLVLVNQKNTFSFFRYIFISPLVRGSSDGARILAHELSHLKHLHSLDRLFIELLTIVFWMNPFIYLYRKELEEVHEYQADRDANQQGDSLKSYFQLVLQQASDPSISPLMSPFSYQLIKKRIIMSTHRSHPLKKLAIFIPLVLGAIILTTSAIISDEKPQEKKIVQQAKEYTWPLDTDTQESNNYTIFDPPTQGNEANQITEDNSFRILINSKSALLVEGRPMAFKDVKPALRDFLISAKIVNQKQIPVLGSQITFTGNVIMFRDRATSQKDADALLQTVLEAFTDVWNKAALQHFSKPFKNCTDEEKDAIKQIHPQRIYLGAPRSNGKELSEDKSTKEAFILPLQPDQVTKIIGWGHRIHPIYKTKKLHQGIDLVAKLNTPIYASQTGTVSKITTEKRGYGKRVEITHNNGYKTLYAHMNDFNVKQGQKINQGDVIGYVGNTSTSTEPHMHFEIHLNGKKIDPSPILKASTLPASDDQNPYGGELLFNQPIRKEELKRIASGYGMRIHPIKKVKMMHNGVDYVAPKNTEVLAISDGTVRKVKNDFEEGKGYGRYIIIDHADGFSSLYAQLNGYKVKEGEKVKKGDVIGLVGSSGISTGPHLHLEIKKDGHYVNPQKFIE